MNGKSWGGAGSLVQRFNLSRFPNGGSQAESNDLGFFSRPKAGHQQNSNTNSSFAKRDGLVERSDAKPTRARLLKSESTFNRAVAVGIRLNDRTHCYSAADMALHEAEILAKVQKRDFRPSWPRGGAFFCRGCDAAYSAVIIWR